MKTQVVNNLYSEEAEKAVIACMFTVTDEAIDEASEFLKPDDFFNPAYREFFSLFIKMRNDFRAIDIPTVHQCLVDLKIADQLGSPGILAEILNSHTSYLNLSSYLKIVSEKAMRRRLNIALKEITIGLTDIEDTNELIAFAEKKVGEALNGIHEKTLKTSVQVAATLRTRIREAVANRGKMIGIPTGFSKLDAITNGWRPSKVIMVAGRPGDGKSVLGENFAFVAATNGFPVGIVTMEMDAEEHGERTMAHEAEISTVRQQNGDITQEELDRYDCALQKFENTSIFYEDCPSLSAINLRAKLRRLVHKFKIKLGIIDYLTLLESDDPKDNEMTKVRKFMRIIKSLARELGIPLIVLAQLNREGAKLGEPELFNIRSAGEDDPDVVILLQRIKERSAIQIDRDLYPTNFKIAKNRGGPTGTLQAMLDAVHNKFHSA